MNTGQWQAAWRIFNAARELPAEEQRRFVESQSADPEIVQRVFDELEALRDEDAAGGGPSAPEIDRTGSLVGRYRVAESAWPRRNGRGICRARHGAFPPR